MPSGVTDTARWTTPTATRLGSTVRPTSRCEPDSRRRHICRSAPRRRAPNARTERPQMRAAGRAISAHLERLPRAQRDRIAVPLIVGQKEGRVLFRTRLAGSSPVDRFLYPDTQRGGGAEAAETAPPEATRHATPAPPPPHEDDAPRTALSVEGRKPRSGRRSACLNGPHRLPDAIAALGATRDARTSQPRVHSSAVTRSHAVAEPRQQVGGLA